MQFISHDNGDMQLNTLKTAKKQKSDITLHRIAMPNQCAAEWYHLLWFLLIFWSIKKRKKENRPI